MGFENIIGQKHAIEQLRKSIISGEVNHALIFLGPESIGKRLAALSYAKALNCEAEIAVRNGDFCDQCRSCNLINLHQHPDVRLLTPETTGDKTVISIDAIRTRAGETPPHPLPLREDAALKPMEGRTKVYIIDPANRPGLQEDAGNALLLTLEEPPKNVVLILITSRPSAVLPTLVSRCHPVRFNLINTDDIVKKLLTINDNEDECRIIAAIANGKLGTAINMANNDHLINIRKRLISEIVRLVPVGIGVSITLAALTRDLANEIEVSERENDTADRKVRRGIPVICDIIASVWRDLLAIKIEGNEHNILNIDIMSEIQNLSKLYSEEKLYLALDSINKTKYYLERNANIDLTLENMWADIL